MRHVNPHLSFLWLRLQSDSDKPESRYFLFLQPGDMQIAEIFQTNIIRIVTCTLRYMFSAAEFISETINSVRQK